MKIHVPSVQQPRMYSWAQPSFTLYIMATPTVRNTHPIPIPWHYSIRAYDLTDKAIPCRILRSTPHSVSIPLPLTISPPKPPASAPAHGFFPIPIPQRLLPPRPSPTVPRPASIPLAICGSLSFCKCSGRSAGSGTDYRAGYRLPGIF